jgi:hypothetical protein
MSDRTFTLQEAHALLPTLESLLRQTITAKLTIETADAEFASLSERILLQGGLKVELESWAKRRAERDKALQVAKDSLAEITAIGVQVKDLDIGLLDFPCLVEGETILLCWKMGESSITHWHAVSEGYAGRKPIDERIARAGDDKIN